MKGIPRGTVRVEVYILKNDLRGHADDYCPPQIVCFFIVKRNTMPGGYWSRTGAADLSGALVHQNVCSAGVP